MSGPQATPSTQHDDASFRDDPLTEADRILSQLATREPDHVFAAVSGGDDSTVALHVANESPHIDLDGIVHLNTGIGVEKTTEYVENIADQLGLPCYVLGDENTRRLDESYQYLCKKFGFPGANPIAHSQVQNNLKSKPFQRFVRSFDGGVALISGVRKLESERRYQVLSDLSENGIKQIKEILWASPIVEFSDTGLDEYKKNHRIRENPVTAILNSSGECLCAYEDRRRITTLKELFPRTAEKIIRLEWQVLEQVCRGEVPREYVLWSHGSVSQKTYDAKMDSEQASIYCADCEDACGETDYSIDDHDPLTPVEAFIQENNLHEFWNYPFFCVPCVRLVTDPLGHRKECHPWEATGGLEGYWDMRMLDPAESDRKDALITEPNGCNLHVNEVVPSKSEAAKYKHRHYYENYALSHCDDAHDWQPFVDGVKQCSECFAFDLSGFDVENPPDPILEPKQVSETELTASEKEKQELNHTLNEFTTNKSPSATPPQVPF
jgi:3'-phosphoadenosine 5'-phosphosulfate sulfotransferase (PAPS reductase)/FAD synthetase